MLRPSVHLSRQRNIVVTKPINGAHSYLPGCHNVRVRDIVVYVSPAANIPFSK